MSKVKKTDHSADVLASIKSQVPTVVDKYLGTKLDNALLRILERHTADLIEKYSVLSGPESIKNQESKKSSKEIIIIKREQGEEKQDSTYSIRSTDKDKSAKKEKDTIQVLSGSAQPPTKDDEQSSKKPRESDASASNNSKLSTSTVFWQITNTRDVVVVSSMHRSDPESKHSEQSSDDIPMQDEGHRLATPELEWTIPPNDFPEPENNWANTYATTYQVPAENKLQRKTYDIGSFINGSADELKEEALQS
ncbi:hypothetical protein Tco_1329179 [Tanacetum coccineum]